MASYQYSPLDTGKREIRVLTLLPGLEPTADRHESSGLRSRFPWINYSLMSFSSYVRDSPISCILDTVSLTACPGYIALSYAWGDPRLVRSIVINGTEVLVTESVYVALQHLRQEHEPLTLWIDALCINQSDKDEKRAQVLQMRKIYEEAKCVLAWLGPEADGSDEVMDCLKRIGRTAEDLELWGISPLQFIEILMNPDSAYSVDTMAKLEDVFKRTDRWFCDQFPAEAYKAFVTRGWWYRVWVVQELSVAREIVFLCGKKKIPHKHLENAAMVLTAYCWSTAEREKSRKTSRNGGPKPAHDAVNAAQSLSAADLMLSFCTAYHQTKCTLLSILKQTIILDDDCLRLRASDERDKIYALLGLAADEEKLSIRIDYHEDYAPASMYLDVSRAILRRGGLEMLAFRPRWNVPNGLPSWACDWGPLVRLPFGDSTHIDRPFHASGTSTFELSFNDQGEVLCIKGIRVGQISRVGTAGTPGSMANLHMAEQDWMVVGQFVAEAAELCHDQSEEEIARILIGDYEMFRLETGLPVPRCRRATASCLEAYQTMKKWLRLPREKTAIEEEMKIPRAEDLQRRTSELTMDLKAHGMAEGASYWTMLRQSLDRRAFRSREGYVGLGPAQLMEGDIVCIFFGADLPFVLRSLDGRRYQLLGEAYVHKVMDGELMGDNAASEIFEIC